MIINANGYDDSTSSITLLWENPNLEDDFRTPTIELELEGYTVLYIVCLSHIAYKYLMVSPVWNDPDIGEQQIENNIGEVLSYRSVTLTSTSISFGAGKYIDFTDPNKIGFGTGNHHLIPYRIYGGV